MDTRPTAQTLFSSIKSSLPSLTALQKDCDEEWGGEDGIYRFYHFSFKTYRIQTLTTKIVTALRALNPVPESPLNSMFEEIIKEGTGKTWEHSHNLEWKKHTRPLLEAYFHAKWMLDMVIKYGKELDSPPNLLPTGWAGVLYLYNIR